MNKTFLFREPYFRFVVTGATAPYLLCDALCYSRGGSLHRQHDQPLRNSSLLLHTGALPQTSKLNLPHPLGPGQGMPCRPPRELPVAAQAQSWVAGLRTCPQARESTYTVTGNTPGLAVRVMQAVNTTCSQ